MAYSFVAERHSARHAAGTSYTVSITAGTTGNLLICMLAITAGTGARSLSSLTDNGTGSAWQTDVSHAASSTLNGVYLVSTKIGSGAPTQITINFSGSVSSALKVIELSGNATSSWFDVGNNAAQAAGTTASTPSISPAASGELIVAAYATNTAQTSFTADSNYTAEGTPPGTGNCEICAQYRLSGTTSENPTGTYASAVTTAAWGAIGSYKTGGSVKTMSATANGAAAVSASVVRTRARGGQVDAHATVSATLVKTGAIAPATINSRATVSASIVRTRARSATANGAATVSSAIVFQAQRANAWHFDYFREGEVLGGQANIIDPGAFDYFRSGEPISVIAVSIPAPGGQVKTLSATANGAASVSSAIVRTRARSASVSAAATVSASVTRTRARTAAVSCAATVTAAVVRTRARPAAVSGSTAVSCTLTRIQPGINVSTAGHTTVTASVVRVRTRTASSAGTALVALSALTRTRARLVSIQASASVACTIVRGRAVVPVSHGAATVSAEVLTKRDLVLPAIASHGTTTVTASLELHAAAPTIGQILFNIEGRLDRAREGALV